MYVHSTVHFAKSIEASISIYVHSRYRKVPYTVRVALTGSFLCPCTCVHTTLSQSAVELRSDVQDV